MTWQTNVLDCKPEEPFLAWAHIENKLARAWLQEFYGRQKIPMDPAATLSEHHAPVTNDGYVMHDHFIFENSFGARILASTKDEIPTPQIVRYDDHSSEQYVALIIVLIILLNQHGDAFKPQADAKEGNTHQAALFASSTQGLSVLRKYEQQDWQALFTSPTQLQALLAATLHTTQRDIPRRRERLQATPSEGRYSWHYDSLSSPHLPPPALALRDDCGPPGAVGDGHRRRFRRGHRTFRGTTGRTEQRAD